MVFLCFLGGRQAGQLMRGMVLVGFAFLLFLAKDIHSYFFTLIHEAQSHLTGHLLVIMMQVGESPY